MCFQAQPLEFVSHVCTHKNCGLFFLNSTVARVIVATLDSVIGFPVSFNSHGEHIAGVVFETGAITLVVSLLRKHQEDSILFDKYLHFVKKLVRYQLTALVQCGAHKIIFLRMKQTLPPGMLDLSFNTLKWMVRSKTGTADSIDFFDTHGGMDMVLRCLETPCDNDHIDVGALHLVRELVFKYPELVSRMCFAGLIPLIFAMLKRNTPGIMQSTVLYSVVEIVSRMTKNSTHIHFVATQSVSKLLFVVMKVFQASACEVTHAMTAICNLTDLNGTTRRAAARKGLVGHVLDHLRLKNNQFELQQVGMRLLLCFMGSWRNVDDVISCGGVVCILRAMSKFSDELSIAQDSLMAISIIAQRDGVREHLLDTEHESHDGIIVCTLTLMRAHEAELLVQRPAVGLLAKLVVGHPNLYADLCNAGAILALSRVLQLPDVDTTTRKMALKLLKACAPVL